jgi:hypothetical protein
MSKPRIVHRELDRARLSGTIPASNLHPQADATRPCDFSSVQHRNLHPRWSRGHSPALTQRCSHRNCSIRGSPTLRRHHRTPGIPCRHTNCPHHGLRPRHLPRSRQRRLHRLRHRLAQRSRLHRCLRPAVRPTSAGSSVGWKLSQEAGYQGTSYDQAHISHAQRCHEPPPRKSSEERSSPRPLSTRHFKARRWSGS